MQNKQILFGNIFKNKKVLITGHTGFKGSWLSIWFSFQGLNHPNSVINNVGNLIYYPKEVERKDLSTVNYIWK